jgi:hypothetical protein
MPRTVFNLRLELPDVRMSASPEAIQMLTWCAATGAIALFAAGAAILASSAGGYVAARTVPVVTLLVMVSLPLAIARICPQRATVATSTALMIAISATGATSAVASATRVATNAGTATACGCLAMAGAALMLAIWAAISRRPPRTLPATPPSTALRLGPARSAAGSIGQIAAVLRPGTGIVLPALLAGLSSGALARFQLFAICGAGAPSPVQCALSFAALVVLGYLCERHDHRHVLIALFALRGLLLAALTTNTAVPLAAFAAPVFAVLDYLTIPTLMRGRESTHPASAGCPGGMHHAGMLAGAALATAPRFFGDGFYLLFLFSTALNLACACLFLRRRATRRLHTPNALRPPHHDARSLRRPAHQPLTP